MMLVLPIRGVPLTQAAPAKELRVFTKRKKYSDKNYRFKTFKAFLRRRHYCKI